MKLLSLEMNIHGKHPVIVDDKIQIPLSAIFPKIFSGNNPHALLLARCAEASANTISLSTGPLHYVYLLTVIGSVKHR